METNDFTANEEDPAARLEPALTILYHPELDRIGERVALPELRDGAAVALSRETPAFFARGRTEGRPLEHACVSRTPLHLRSRPDGGVGLDSNESRTKVLHKDEPLKGELVVSPNALRRGEVFVLGGRIVLLLHQANASVAADGDDLGLLGESAGIQRVRADVLRVADLDVSVLVRGGTGTGKELVARAIHRSSGRRDGPFVPVNLGAIAPELAGSELFGSERGAFTGSVARQPGYFSAAHGGTLFLDEIGEAPPSIQAALLRVLETGEIQRVGAQRREKADVRVIAATDADLEGKIRDGSFRAPLLHRLSSYEIAMPPLRERRDDVGRLLLVFLREELQRIGEAHRFANDAGDPPWLPATLMAKLVSLDWPGNVRQLQNVARQLVIGSRGEDRIRHGPAIEHLLAETAAPPPSTRAPASEASRDRPASREPAPDAASAARRKPGETTEEELVAALRANRWDLVATAAALRLSRASLYVLIQRSSRLRTAGEIGAEEIIRCHRECDGDLERMIDRLEVSGKALRRRVRELGLE
jgi:two-component system nitrogen regulation response regulator GlnG